MLRDRYNGKISSLQMLNRKSSFLKNQKPPLMVTPNLKNEKNINLNNANPAKAGSVYPIPRLGYYFKGRKPSSTLSCEIASRTDFIAIRNVLDALESKIYGIKTDSLQCFSHIYDDSGISYTIKSDTIMSELRSIIQNYPFEELFPERFDYIFIQLSRTPNSLERLEFIEVMLSYYNTFPKKQIRIVDLVFSQLYMCREGFVTPMSVMPLLSFLNEIKSRNCEMSIIRNHVNGCLIPFLSSPHLVCFFNELFSLLDYYSSISRNTSISIIEYLIHTFPISNLSKQGLYVKLMNSIVFRLSVSSFHEYCSRIFHFYCRCLESFHVQSIESFYDLVEDGYFKNRIVDKSSLVTSIIMSSIERLSSTHWNQSIRNRSFQFIKFMKLFDKNCNSLSTENLDTKSKITWKLIKQSLERKHFL